MKENTQNVLVAIDQKMYLSFLCHTLFASNLCYALDDSLLYSMNTSTYSGRGAAFTD